MNCISAINGVCGIQNLHIEKYPGVSKSISGLPEKYSSTAELINPLYADINWNNTFNRLEISFEVNGFGGFFATSQSTRTSLNELNGGLVSWQASDYKPEKIFYL